MIPRFRSGSEGYLIGRPPWSSTFSIRNILYYHCIPSTYVTIGKIDCTIAHDTALIEDAVSGVALQRQAGIRERLQTEVEPLYEPEHDESREPFVCSVSLHDSHLKSRTKKVLFRVLSSWCGGDSP